MNLSQIRFKTVITGDGGVGKTSLLVRIAKDEFLSPQYAHKIAFDFVTRLIDMDGEKIKLILWDSYGLERFRTTRTCTSSFFRGAHGVILAFDITCRDSFNNLRSWIKEVDMNGGDQMAKIIVGNKSDLKEKRVVSYDEAQDFADTINIPYFETSAKTASSVEEACIRLTAEMKKMLDSGVFKMSVNPPVKLQEDRDRKGADYWPCGGC